MDLVNSCRHCQMPIQLHLQRKVISPDLELHLDQNSYQLRKFILALNQIVMTH